MADQTLSADDLMLKRGFKGDKDVFEATVSEDGKVMVVLDTRKDEKVLSQKLAREIVSRIQKLRKKSGLQVGETVEVRWRDSETRRPKGQKIAPTFFVLLRQGVWWMLELGGRGGSGARLLRAILSVRHRERTELRHVCFVCACQW